MIDLKAFRKKNGMTQVDLANYLGIGQAFISQIEKGDRPLPKEYISILLANPHGWDVSMLTESEDMVGREPDLDVCKPALSNVELLLWNQLAEKDAKIDALNEVIWQLKEEIGSLKNQLKYKGGTAPSVAGSSDANVG